MFFAYLFSIRKRDQDYLFQMGRLYQELIIFARITMDNSRLMWQLTHQKELRAEKYSSLREEVGLRRREGMDVESTAGKRVVLGSSFQGGPRMSKEAPQPTPGPHDNRFKTSCWKCPTPTQIISRGPSA